MGYLNLEHGPQISQLAPLTDSTKVHYDHDQQNWPGAQSDPNPVKTEAEIYISIYCK